MVTLRTDVLVIGGGATGAGVAWDAALRGFDVVLAERKDLAEGTSGRVHGLVDSGGGYAVKDPRAAEECVAENRVLRNIAADSLEDTGGFFVTTRWDDPVYADRFAQGCLATGVQCEEISPAQALREEPRLNPDISRVFRVPDANVDVWKLVGALTRDVTRSHTLLDHSHRDGVSRFLTITGGKLTTFRLMAEHTVDAVCRALSEDRPCTTTAEPLPGSEERRHYHLGERLGRKEARLADEQLICDCEMVSRSALEDGIRRRATTNLDDIRRLLRLGMGPCQGGFCMYRATGVMHGLDGIGTEDANGALLDFLQERWKGVRPILYGDQLRQARLDDWIFQGVLDVGHLSR